MPRRKETITGLHIHDNYISCAQGLPAEQFIANISIQPIEPGAADRWAAIESGFRELIGEIKLTNESVIASLPGEFAVIREFMADADANIDDAIEWEFSQQIIGSREDFVFDYQEIGSQKGADTRRFLVAGYRNDAVQRLGALLRSNKLNPAAIDLDVFALANAYELNYPDRMDDPVCIVSAEENQARLILIRQGRFGGIESLTAGEITGAEESIQQLSEALERLKSDYAHFIGDGFLRTYLTGSIYGDEQLASQTMERIHNSEVLSPFRSISCSAEMQDEELQKKYGPQLAAAVGLALRGV